MKEQGSKLILWVSLGLGIFLCLFIFVIWQYNNSQNNQAVNMAQYYHEQQMSNENETNQAVNDPIRTYASQWFPKHEKALITILNDKNAWKEQTGQITKIEYIGLGANMNSANLPIIRVFFENYPDSKMNLKLSIKFDDAKMKNINAGATINLFDTEIDTYGDSFGSFMNTTNIDLTDLFGYHNSNATELEQEAVIVIK